MVIVIKVFRSAQTREDGGNSLAARKVSSVETFDAAVEEFSFPARYLAFELEDGTKLGTRDIARNKLLEALSPDEYLDPSDGTIYEVGTNKPIGDYSERLYQTRGDVLWIWKGGQRVDVSLETGQPV